MTLLWASTPRGDGTIAATVFDVKLQAKGGRADFTCLVSSKPQPSTPARTPWSSTAYYRVQLYSYKQRSTVVVARGACATRLGACIVCLQIIEALIEKDSA